MRIFSLLSLIVIAAFSLPACNQSQSSPAPPANVPAEALAPYFDPDWARNRLWDDGQAEVAIYDAERIIYGKTRRFEYVFATVKETFNTEYQVKTNDYTRDDLFEVIKLNMFARIETDNYPYHFLSSLFHRRDQPAGLYKMTHSSQEWCGNAFKEFLASEDGLAYSWNSYWDGEGSGSRTLDAGVLLEDALPYSLRSLRFEEGLRFRYPLMRSEIDSHADAPVVEAATFEVLRDTVAGAGEPAVPAWRVDVRGPVDISYWFGTEYPHALLRMEHSDGRSLRLRSLRRWAYWQI